MVCETLPVTVAVYVVPCPPVMPVGDVNVMFRVNDPLTDWEVSVLRKNEPKLLAPCREPMPFEVVTEKFLPLNDNWGTPVTAPVVEPEIVNPVA